MPSYVCAMSEGDIDVLEEIFIEKYSEFVDCYWMLRQYSEDIKTLSYDKKKKDALSIKFTLDKLNPEDIVHELRQISDDRVKVTRSKEKIQLVINKR
jgi:hypothetical protein